MKTKKTHTIESVRLMSSLLPISKAAKKKQPELNFDVYWGEYDTKQYTIDKDGYLCIEKCKKKRGTNSEIISLQKTNITQDIILETEIAGKNKLFKLNVVNGLVKSINNIKDKF